MTNAEILQYLREALEEKEKITMSDYELLLERFESLINEKYQLEQSLAYAQRDLEDDK